MDAMQWALAACALLALVPAHAVNKCTDPKTARVTYTDAPCPPDPGASSAQVRLTQNVVQGVSPSEWRELQVRSAVNAGRVVIGMSEGELIAAWGYASTVNTDVYSGRTKKQFVYDRGPEGGVQYVYTDNGIVTAIQDRPALPARSVLAEDKCYTDTEIRNARVSASSITLTEAERIDARRRIDRMRRCR